MTRLLLILIAFLLLSTLEAEEDSSDQNGNPIVDQVEGLNSEQKELLLELRRYLVSNGVPGAWFDEHVTHEKFTLYPKVPQYFEKSPERRVDRTEEKDLDWYFNLFRVDIKIERGLSFIEENRTVLEQAEQKNGIHKELITAILGMETHFASNRQKGKFLTFNTLVTQYLMTDRKRFSSRELVALYKFSQRSRKPVWYFIGSYAGAAGWGQFIPTSMEVYFRDAAGDEADMDIYAVDDNIFSIENYLFRNGLNGSNIDNEKALYRGVHSYNHSDAYVKAVLHIYRNLRKLVAELEKEDDESPTSE